MAKDYAKATFKITRARAKQRARRNLLIFIIAILGITGVFVWFFHQTPSSLTFTERATALISECKLLLHRHKSEESNQNAKAETVVAEAQEPEEPEVHFDFYNALPNMQVNLPATQDEPRKGTPPLVTTPPPVATTLAPSATPVSTPITASSTSATQSAPPASHYVVQIGAYKSDSTASEMRISILLAGFDVKVVKSTKDNKTIYRIQHGPFGSLASAKAAQKKLQLKGFEGVIAPVS